MPEDNSAASKQELKEALNHLRDELIEAMRDMQTEVLRAFHDWARPVEIKLRTLPQLDERLGLLEERISRIERGELPPRPRHAAARHCRVRSARESIDLVRQDLRAYSNEPG